jgi:hypothetical protein
MHLAIRAALVLVFAAGFVAALVTHRSERRVDEGFESILADDPRERSLEIFDESRPLNPLAERDVAVAYLQLEEGRRAEVVLEDATRREPDNPLVWVALAQVHRCHGDREASIRAYARARELDSQLPRTPLPPPSVLAVRGAACRG